MEKIAMEGGLSSKQKADQEKADFETKPFFKEKPVWKTEKKKSSLKASPKRGRARSSITRKSPGKGYEESTKRRCNPLDLLRKRKRCFYKGAAPKKGKDWKETSKRSHPEPGPTGDQRRY